MYPSHVGDGIEHHVFLVYGTNFPIKLLVPGSKLLGLERVGLELIHACISKWPYTEVFRLLEEHMKARATTSNMEVRLLQQCVPQLHPILLPRYRTCTSELK